MDKVFDNFNLPKTLEKAWNVMFKRFFNHDTNLFYEFVTTDDNNAWHHLPTIEEINKQIPNPCGWGTGMEDSVMNGGMMLYALVWLHKITKNTDGIKPLCDKLLDGLMLCAGSEIDPGFVARSISPFDGKSHYIETSRDQYTHFVHACLEFFKSPLCSDLQKERIKTAIVNLAKKCEKDVTKETDYNMRREDGSIGMVAKMWGELGAHEWLRMPMFYLAAYVVTKNPHWKEKYMQYRDEALEKSMSHIHDISRSTCFYTTVQLQCSLDTVYHNDDDVKDKILKLMKRNAQTGEALAIKCNNRLQSGEFDDNIYYKFKKWSEVEPFRKGIYGGYNYDNPAQSDRKDNPTFYPLRAIGEGTFAAAICPQYDVSAETKKALLSAAEYIDFDKYTSVYLPLYLICAYICLS